MLEKPNSFCLTSLMTLVLLMWKWMGLFLRKNQFLRCLDWRSVTNWIKAHTLSLLLKLQNWSWFILWSVFLLRLLCISINSDRLHYFSVTIPRCYMDVYVNSFFPCTAKLWNSLPVECFPLTYNLNGFKSRINRHLLTVGSFWRDFLYALIFLCFFFLQLHAL